MLLRPPDDRESKSHSISFAQTKCFHLSRDHFPRHTDDIEQTLPQPEHQVYLGKAIEC